MTNEQGKGVDIESLLMSHYECEDCWYSCPLSEEGTCNDDLPNECNCGANEHNALVWVFKEKLTAQQELIGEIERLRHVGKTSFWIGMASGLLVAWLSGVVFIKY